MEGGGRCDTIVVFVTLQTFRLGSKLRISCLKAEVIKFITLKQGLAVA